MKRGFMLGGGLLAWYLMVVAACSSVVHLSGTGGRYSDPGTRIAVESSVRIFVVCPVEGGERILGFGSGVAISSNTLITARHVAVPVHDGISPCDSGAEPRFRAMMFDGRTVPVYTAKLLTADVALMRVSSQAHPFNVTAKPALRAPIIGESVTLAGGTQASIDDVPESFALKRGTVSSLIKVQDSVCVLVSVHLVPGNSGSAVFTASGEILGIAVMGSWFPTSENYGIAVAVPEFAEFFQ